jgi:hypothetical protein
VHILVSVAERTDTRIEFYESSAYCALDAVDVQAVVVLVWWVLPGCCVCPCGRGCGSSETTPASLTQGQCSRIAGPSCPFWAYVAMSVRHHWYVYGSDLRHGKGGSAINKGKLEKQTTMGSRCNGRRKTTKNSGIHNYR